MRSIRTTVAASALCAVLAAPAGADPLVSGYGGPGSGDQSILGATLLPASPGRGTGGGGPPSIRATARPRPAAATSGTPAAPAAAGSTPPTSSRKQAKRGTADAGTKRRRPASSQPAAPAAAPIAAAPAARSGAGTSAGALPTSGPDLLLALAVAGGLGLVALASVRLVRRGAGPSAT